MIAVIGRRKGFEKYHGEFPPSNIPLATIGAAMLWIGWCVPQEAQCCHVFV
jgi:ammonia channel protein AmtB